MDERTTVDTLNRLLALHARSLPVYLASARPWFPERHSEAEAVLRDVAADQQLMADRIGAVILDLGGSVLPSEFPMEFTDLHDLSIDYLMPRIVGQLQQEMEWIRQAIDSLRDVPSARAIAEEALGAAQAHLDCLNELSDRSPVA